MPGGLQSYTVIKLQGEDIVTLASQAIRCHYVPKPSGACLTNGCRLFVCTPSISVSVSTTYSVAKRTRAINYRRTLQEQYTQCRIRYLFK